MRDLGTNTDVRKTQITPSTNDQDMFINGSGVGFLLKVERITPTTGKNHRKAPKIESSRYRLRARWAITDGDDDAMKFDLPGQ